MALLGCGSQTDGQCWSELVELCSVESRVVQRGNALNSCRIAAFVMASVTSTIEVVGPSCLSR